MTAEPSEMRDIALTVLQDKARGGDANAAARLAELSLRLEADAAKIDVDPGALTNIEGARSVIAATIRDALAGEVPHAAAKAALELLYVREDRLQIDRLEEFERRLKVAMEAAENRRLRVDPDLVPSWLNSGGEPDVLG